MSLPDDRIHAPNETADLELLLARTEAAAHPWSDRAATRER